VTVHNTASVVQIGRNEKACTFSSAKACLVSKKNPYKNKKKTHNISEYKKVGDVH